MSAKNWLISLGPKMLSHGGDVDEMSAGDSCSARTHPDLSHQTPVDGPRGLWLVYYQ
jgi:hypothetical protein